MTADNDDFYNRAKELGEIAASAFGNRHRSQMTNLENIANSTLKVSDVLDYIKKQVARSRANESWRKDNLGKQLKDYIEEDIRGHRQRICDMPEIQTDAAVAQHAYLSLIREFIRQLVVHFEWTLVEGTSS